MLVVVVVVVLVVVVLLVDVVVVVVVGNLQIQGYSAEQVLGSMIIPARIEAFADQVMGNIRMYLAYTG